MFQLNQRETDLLSVTLGASLTMWPTYNQLLPGKEPGTITNGKDTMPAIKEGEVAALLVRVFNQLQVRDEQHTEELRVPD